MSEIEKMYENCGIEPQYWCSYKDTWCPIRDIGKFNPKCAKTEVTKDCDARSHIAQLPKFTAEKQLELIKFLLKNYEGVDISKKINRFNFLVDNATFMGCHHNDKSFEESLAGVINKLWADMPEEEKQQVKGILE